MMLTAAKIDNCISVIDSIIAKIDKNHKTTTRVLVLFNKKNKNLKEFKSIQEACDYLGISRRLASKLIDGSVMWYEGKSIGWELRL